MKSWLLHVYRKSVIERPVLSLWFVFLLVAFFVSQAGNLKLDASAESLVLENDPALQYYRAIHKVYGTDDFLVVTFTPHDDLLSPVSLAGLKALRDELAQLGRVESVVTILDVPLLNSPRVTFSELADMEEVRTLQTPGVDKELARQEFMTSPLYANNLVSHDGQTTVLQINFQRDKQYDALLTQRDELRAKKESSGLTDEELEAFRNVSEEFKAYHARTMEIERYDIQKIRAILEQYRGVAQLHLGGARMITTDMIRFIEHDIRVFGLGVVLFLLLALGYFFRRIRWVVLPLSCCLLSVSVMVGFLGLFDWPVTVISSNFISLLLIITMSLTIHLIVRYRLLMEQNPEADQKTQVFNTMRILAKPSLYTAITTIVAFCSLIVSDVRPVIDFGWMMTIGIAFALVINFLYFPAALTLLRPENVVVRPDSTRLFTKKMSVLAVRYAKLIVLGCLVLAALGVAGISQLEVENRFIDNFKSSTEIYQGMELIDLKLGGTMPLEFIIDADADFYASLEDLSGGEAEADPFADPFADEEEEEITYWFNGDMLAKVEDIHDHLESLPEVGKVISIATAIKVFKQLNDGRMPEDYELAVLRKMVPDEVKKELIDPYLSPDGNQIRLTMRLIESSPTLRRQALIDNIQAYLVEEMKFDAANVHPTGMAVLYNNLLQSLFRSQILTLGVVFVSILAMFIVLFGRVRLSLLAIMPNLLAAGLVLGLMGWAGIPLDLMTITIAAITIGIGVDDTIHYVHRFQLEFPIYRNYVETVQACHRSIGIAMYYTSLTIAAGFSILTLSNFIPTIYFGLLTGFAMLIALLSNLTLLPSLLLLVKPVGQEQDPG